MKLDWEETFTDMWWAEFDGLTAQGNWIEFSLKKKGDNKWYWKATSADWITEASDGKTFKKAKKDAETYADMLRAVALRPHRLRDVRGFLKGPPTEGN